VDFGTKTKELQQGKFSNIIQGKYLSCT
jgi:hypothetical protein